MSPDRWREVSDLFDRAADLDPADRPAFIEREARMPDGSPDPALREEVERLLALDADAEAFLSGLAPDEPAPPEAGPWSLHERVGVGGMGEVWRAERRDADAEGFRQTAAVKLVRPGLADADARFRAERRILAGLEHPAIARLLDGGTASDGRPYLATEFVEGEPITAHADRRRLGVNERLALFLDVCDAVAYAHARLVVHRDLKPSNVLVAETDGDARVKLLDFGIAKLLDDADPALTRTGRPVLTPAYAAPEQRGGGPVTTATDVYGLGVLLYELLTGRRPDRHDLTRPSEAVTESAPTGGRVPPDPAGAAPTGGTGALRSTTTDRLRRRLRGDLDQICLTALREDPSRRYRGAAELGADVRRHLDGLPVEARPESVAYRAGKFVRRNRGLVAALTVALVAVLGGAGAALWQAAEANRQRDAATDREAEAQAVTDFFVEMIGDARPPGSDGDSLRVRNLLDSGAAQLDTVFADRPSVRAALAQAFALGYDKLGKASAALPLYREVLRLRSMALPPGDPDLIRSENALAVALLNTGGYAELDTFLTRAVAERRHVLGPDHLAVAMALQNLAYALHLSRDSSLQTRSEGYYLEALAIIENPDRIAHPQDTLYATINELRAPIYNALASHYMETGRNKKAVEPMMMSLELTEFEEGSFEHIVMTNNYGVLLRELGRYGESAEVHRQVVRVARESFGTDHFAFGHPMLSLGIALQRNGDFLEAIPILEEALRVFGGESGDGRTNHDARFHLGLALVGAGRVGEGRRILRAAIPGLIEGYGSDDWRVEDARRALD